METYNFKGDLTSSIFKLMGRILLIVIILQIISSLLQLGGMAVLIPGMAEMQEALQGMAASGATDPEQALGQMMAIFQQYNISFGSIGLMILVMMILSYIVYNIIYNGIKNEVHGGDNSIGAAIRGAFDMRILHYILLAILLLIGFGIVGYILTLLPPNVYLLLFLTLVIILPLYCWFAFVSMASIGLKNHNVIEALGFAASKLTIVRHFKFLGVGALAMIVFVIIAFIVSLLLGMVATIPGVGMILSSILNAVLGAVIIAFTISAAAALIYRYLGFDSEAEEKFVVTD